MPPDPNSCTQAIKRAHHQAFKWRRCLQNNIEDIDLKENGWKISSDGHVVPVWYTCSQLPESVKRKPKDKKTKENNYDADNESEAKNLEPLSKKQCRRSTLSSGNNQVQSEYPDADHEATNTEYEEFTENPDLTSENQNEWEEFSDFSSTESDPDSSDSDWAP